MIQEHEVVKKL